MDLFGASSAPLTYTGTGRPAGLLGCQEKASGSCNKCNNKLKLYLEIRLDSFGKSITVWEVTRIVCLFVCYRLAYLFIYILPENI